MIRGMDVEFGRGLETQDLGSLGVEESSTLARHGVLNLEGSRSIRTRGNLKHTLNCRILIVET